jgi:hypothetical protein
MDQMCDPAKSKDTMIHDLNLWPQYRTRRLDAKFLAAMALVLAAAALVRSLGTTVWFWGNLP